MSESQTTAASETNVELLYHETRELLLRQIDNMDQIDTKASIIAGFSGLIITSGLSILPDLPDLAGHSIDPTLITVFPACIIVAFGITLLSFALAVWSYRVRSYKEVLNPRSAYNKYMRQPVEQTKVNLLHNLIDSYEKNQKIVDRKASLVHRSMCALFVAVFLYVVVAVIYVRVVLL